MHFKTLSFVHAKTEQNPHPHQNTKNAKGVSREYTHGEESELMDVLEQHAPFTRVKQRKMSRKLHNELAWRSNLIPNYPVPMLPTPPKPTPRMTFDEEGQWNGSAESEGHVCLCLSVPDLAKNKAVVVVYPCGCELMGDTWIQSLLHIGLPQHKINKDRYTTLHIDYTASYRVIQSDSFQCCFRRVGLFSPQGDACPK